MNSLSKPPNVRSLTDETVDFIRQRAPLSCTNLTSNKLPTWLVLNKPQTIDRFNSQQILALIKARNEGFVALELLWDDSFSQIEDPELSASADLKSQWPMIEKIVKRKLLNSAKLGAELKIIEQLKLQLNLFAITTPKLDGNFIVIDPGARSGLKLVVVNTDGDIISRSILFPHEPQNQWTQCLRKLDNCVQANRVSNLVLAEGEGYRETRQFLKTWLAQQEKQFDVFHMSSDGLSYFSPATDSADVDPLYRRAETIAKRFLLPTEQLPVEKLKCLLKDPLATAINQCQLQQQLSKHWLTLFKSAQQREVKPDQLITHPALELADIKPGTKITARILTKTQFGFFVDIGLMENGLLHQSKVLPNQQLNVGDLIELRIIDVNLEKKQFSLSQKPPQTAARKPKHKSSDVRPKKATTRRAPENSAMADALSAAFGKKS